MFRNFRKRSRNVSMPVIMRFLLLGLAGILLFINVSQFVALALIVGVTASIIPRSARYSRLDQTVFIIVCLFATITLLGALAWIIGIKLNDTAILGCLWIVATVTTSLRVLRSPNASNISRTNRLTLYFPIIIASTVFLVLVGQLIIKINTNYIYQYVTSGGDNLSHIELINVTDRSDGYRYGTSSTLGNEFTSSQTTYPQGMHLSTAFLRDLLPVKVDFTKSVKLQLYFYSFAMSLFFSLFTYVFTALSVRFITGRKNILRAIIILSVTTAVLCGLILDFYLNGFQPHIFSLLLLLTELALVISVGDLATLSRRKAHAIIVLLLLLSIGISFSWLFLLPTALLINAYYILFLDSSYLLSAIRNKDKRLIIQTILWWILFLTMALVSLIQVFVQLAYGSKSNPIVEAGFINTINPAYIALFGTAALMFVEVVRRKYPRDHTSVKHLAVFVIASGIFTTFIFLYQLVSVGSVQYYFFKAGYTLIILGAISLGALLLIVIDTLPIFKQRLATAIIGTSIVLFALANISPNISSVIYGTVQGLGPDTANAFAENVYVSGRRIVSVGSCNRGQDFIATRLAGVTRFDDRLQQDLSFGQLSSKFRSNEFLARINRVANPNNKILVIDNGNDVRKDVLKNPSVTYLHLGKATGARCAVSQ